MGVGSEWVYNPFSCGEEADLFETESVRSTWGAAIFRHGFVESPASYADEPTCFGDVESDYPEKLTDPLELFSLYGERSFPSGVPLNFSEDLYLHRKGLDSRPSPTTARFGSMRAEAIQLDRASRADNIMRLRKQLQALERDELESGTGDKIDFAEEAPLLPFNDLRVRLDSLAGNKDVGHGRTDVSTSLAELRSSKQACADMTFEHRLSRLESALAACACRGSEGLWALVRSLRLQLNTMDTSSMSEIRAKVESLAASFERSPAFAEFVDMSQLLRRLDDLEPTASCIPVLTSRLRSLKATLDDSSSATFAIAELAAKCDELNSTRRENDGLLQRLQLNLEGNMTSTCLNMDALTMRLENALAAVSR
jgi:Dynamitin